MTSEARVAGSEQLLRAKPSDPQLLAGLAAAYMDRARATADPSWYARAEAACERSLAASPGNYEALRLRSWILAGQHRFFEAAASARETLRMRPFDPWNYGTLGDALVETGDYDGAAEAFQKMIDLRPDTASYARVSYIRELFGDTDGAIEAMSLAAQSANPFDAEKGAWCHAQLGDLFFSKGDLKHAAFEYHSALSLAPHCPGALGGAARVCAAEGRLEEAARLYETTLSVAPSPLLAGEYGDLLMKLGRAAEAKRQYELVEVAGRILKATTGLFDRQIALFRADHDIDPEGALAIAQRELTSRKDIYGYDTLAWCAFKTGRKELARQAIRQALKLGTRDARLHYHAGLIALGSGDRAEARRHLRDALRINPYFDPNGSVKAREALARLGGPAPSAPPSEGAVTVSSHGARPSSRMMARKAS